MEQFRTTFAITPSQTKISHHSPCLFIGSCFTENIGNKLLERKFDVQINPFGILYNPLSVANSLNAILDNRKFTRQDLSFDGQLYYSYFHHGRFSSTLPENTLNTINTELLRANLLIKSAKFVFITFGTAWAYEHLTKNIVVTNCHKSPAKTFKRYRICLDEIFSNISIVIEKLLAQNPDIQIIFTVSPVRHWKDGAHENQLSKSTLLLAIDKIAEKYQNNVDYFPAYELVMDDLRDYRFYKTDMLHPSNLAVEYIWSRFEDTYFSPATKAINSNIETIIKAMNHRALNTKTEAHRKFLNSFYFKTKQLSERLQHANFSVELEYFKSH